MLFPLKTFFNIYRHHDVQNPNSFPNQNLSSPVCHSFSSILKKKIVKMPSIAGDCPSLIDGGNGIGDARSKKSGNGRSTPMKRRSTSGSPISPPSPMKWNSPRRCLNLSPALHIPPKNVIEIDSSDRLLKSHIKLVDNLPECFDTKLKWNPKVSEQINAVKEVLHVSMAPSTVVCRENEQNRVLEFCKMCVQEDKAGSLYVCGCPGTGKSLSMDKMKQLLLSWAGEAGFQQPDVLSVSCASLTNTSEIFSKILGNYQPPKKVNGSISPLQTLKKIYTNKQQSSATKMTLIIADELDYLITKDRAVLHDLFMLTTLPYSRSILIGIANAIDLADRFLPKLQSLNCKPMVITFRAYSKDQILKILQQRLMALPYNVFHPQALELCARKVAAASGDMRKALSVCRSAIEMLEIELNESTKSMDRETVKKGLSDLQVAPVPCVWLNQEIDTVRADHMIDALSKTYKSPILDTIQSLPQHQQILLCSAVKLFRRGKKDTTIGELNKFYLEMCKSSQIPPSGILELSSMCTVLSDQGLLKLGQSREDKLKRVTLKVDESDISFALQGVRFFRNCLQSECS